VFCVKCGTQAAEDARFCRACGAELRVPAQPQGVSAAAPTPIAQSAPAAAARPASAPAPNGGVRYAGFWRRVWAALLDGLLAWLLWMAFSAAYELAAASWLGSREFAPDGRELLGALSAISVGRSVLGTAVFVAYFALAETSPMGATLGKRLLGMRVTKVDGSRVGIVRSLSRNLLKGLSAALLMIGFAMAGFTKRKQALHDLMTRTLVVRR
jgi:uncharacterized RDD family membrane protein YckC